MEGDWFGLAASAAGGGVFGVLGTALGRVAGYFETRQKQVFEQSRWHHDLSVRQLEMEARRVHAETEIDIQTSKGSWEGLSASLKADAVLASGYPIVNAIRALTRPTLTLLLWLITTLVFFHVDRDLQARIVDTSVFAATAATLWWFGDRTHPRGEGAVSGRR